MRENVRMQMMNVGSDGNFDVEYMREGIANEEIKALDEEKNDWKK